MSDPGLANTGLPNASSHPGTDPSASPAPAPSSGGGGGGGGGRTFTDTEFRHTLEQELAVRMARAREELSRSISAEFSRRYGASIDDLTELPKLREWKAEHDRKQAEEEGNYQKILQSKDEEFQAKTKSWQDRERELLTGLEDALITGKIVAAASGKAVKPDQVAHLLSARVRLDPKTLVASVLDAQGEPRYKGGRPVTIEELVDEFLEAEQHFAIPPSTLPKGSGSVGSTGGEPQSGDGGDGTSVATLKARHAEAVTKAERSGHTADILEAHQLKKQIAAAEKQGSEAGAG